MDPKDSSDRPEVMVNFRMSKLAHQELMTEVDHCGCNLSGFVRSAVMRDIYNRRQLRKQHADHAILAGQIDIEGRVNA